MINSLEAIYDGDDLPDATLGVLEFRSPGGTIKAAYLYVGGNVSGDAVFNLTKEGVALWTLADRLTVATATDEISKINLNIATARGDVIQLDLEECPAGGVASPITLILEIDDGVAAGGASLTDEQLQDKVAAMFDPAQAVYDDETSTIDIQFPASGPGGATDHGALTGLADDDHPQYFNQTRGDARYAPVSALVAKADLVAGKVPAEQLPSYVDDVLEYANLAAFPAIGETGKIYIALDTNFEYRWSGSVYIQLVSSPGSSDAVPEGATNLYFTAARVWGVVLTGIVFSSNAAITAADTILVALGKLQAQITAVVASLSNYLPTSYLDTDATLAANSDSKIATQKAVKAFVAANAGGAVSTTTPDTPPTAPSIYDDEFTGSGLDAKWATGGAGMTVTVAGGAAQISLPASSNSNAFKGFRQTLPVGNFTATAKLSWLMSFNDSSQAGITIHQADNGRAYFFGLGNSGTSSPQIMVFSGASDAVIAASQLLTAPFRQISTAYLRVRFDGTNYYFEHSLDGKNFIIFHQVAKLAYLTAVATRIGFAAYAYTNSVPQALQIDWFRITTP